MIRFISWILRGKPMVRYDGGNCGCCGAWVQEVIIMRDYQATDRWFDTWTLCNACTTPTREDV